MLPSSGSAILSSPCRSLSLIGEPFLLLLLRDLDFWLGDRGGGRELDDIAERDGDLIDS